MLVFMSFPHRVVTHNLPTFAQLQCLEIQSTYLQSTSELSPHLLQLLIEDQSLRHFGGVILFFFLSNSSLAPQTTIWLCRTRHAIAISLWIVYEYPRNNLKMRNQFFNIANTLFNCCTQSGVMQIKRLLCIHQRAIDFKLFKMITDASI